MNKKNSKGSVHLICNAHIDPVWLWTWPEALAEAVSTFRIAARFCEEHQGFVFNHNEALLYEWIEEYDSPLFMHIKDLVKRGLWNIMGGWYLQPDCNIPCGEAQVRQIRRGRKYFQDKFGKVPTVAINFDPFGHSRGLVQILTRCGYSGYVFGRPAGHERELPGKMIRWIGFDGSEIKACRPWGSYGSQPGKGCQKIKDYLNEFPDEECGIVMWGIGNHGGGPSEQDLQAISELMKETPDRQICHSSMESFFVDFEQKNRFELPVHADDLSGCLQGCYSTMPQLKLYFRKLENELWLTEKMLTHAYMQKRIEDYPHSELEEAERDILVASFHDTITGTSIMEVEQQTLSQLGHGLEILERLKYHAFFKLLGGAPAPDEGDYPLWLYNPHPYPVKQVVDCELALEDWTTEQRFTPVEVWKNGVRLPSQMEQQSANHNIDFRKRVVFEAECPPASFSYFACRKAAPLNAKPIPKQIDNEDFTFNGKTEVAVCCQSGRLKRWAVSGFELLNPSGITAKIVKDNPDPWSFSQKRWSDTIGIFEPLTPDESAEWAGLDTLPASALRIIEDGDIRTVTESAFKCLNSRLVQRCYFARNRGEIQLDMRVSWNETDSMLKLELPLNSSVSRLVGQTAYGIQELHCDGTEQIAQQWIGLEFENGQMLTIINDRIYGLDCDGEKLSLTLLRSPSYAGLPMGHPKTIVPTDRITPRQSQGDHFYRFWLNAGSVKERLDAVDIEAQYKHEPVTIVAGPPPCPGAGFNSAPLLSLEGPGIKLVTMKPLATNPKAIFLRLFETTGYSRAAILKINAEINQRLDFAPFEIKTVMIEGENVAEVDELIT